MNLEFKTINKSAKNIGNRLNLEDRIEKLQESGSLYNNKRQQR